jgi:hypothetical protein
MGFSCRNPSMRSCLKSREVSASCEHGVDEIPAGGPPGVIGVAAIDNLLNQWFKEHRPKELRRHDAESEHAIRDLTRIRPPKGTRPKPRR